MNQSKLEVITWRWRTTLETVCERVIIGFSLISDWTKKSCEFLSQSYNVLDPKLITFQVWNENHSRSERSIIKPTVTCSHMFSRASRKRVSTLIVAFFPVLYVSFLTG